MIRNGLFLTSKHIITQRLPHRPPTSPACQADVPFCAVGRTPNTMPTVGDNDTLFVYAMSRPKWEFKLLKKYRIMHDAIGFHHVQSGANFTMEWYELSQLLNCTFPHLLGNETLLWCNQGATCVSDGIDEESWKQNGTLVQVATITGETFNRFANWTEYDNNTGVFYETWTVKEKPDGQTWFTDWSSASWVLRAFQTLHMFGAKFNQSVHLYYTRLNIYSHEPVLLGNASTIFDNKDKQHLANEIRRFYSHFQFPQSQSMADLIKELTEAFFEVMIEGKSYLFYNQLYWYLHIIAPFFQLTYEEVKLPGVP
ncbi:bis(monoacylglycero)phosphate synthase CLN5-like isoform X2 [Babylonia areolata]|uniref:bis(monoacylglycero)phosphate synthase CLN5-like isoform X2 n=1 Tax=Babylonia areolata TaxID=304850 RepID=UPI003FD14760